MSDINTTVKMFVRGDRVRVNESYPGRVETRVRRSAGTVTGPGNYAHCVCVKWDDLVSAGSVAIDFLESLEPK